MIRSEIQLIIITTIKNDPDWTRYQLDERVGL